MVEQNGLTEMIKYGQELSKRSTQNFISKKNLNWVLNI